MDLSGNDIAAIIFFAVCIAGLLSKFNIRKILDFYTSRFIAPQRLEHIKRHRFGSMLRDKVKDLHPNLTTSDLDKVFEGLQQFFLVAHHAKYEVSMPSKVVDDAWHQFLLFSNEYFRFCKEAFGDYFHHKPYPKNEEMEESDTIPISLLRTWALACRLEGIDPKQPDKLPLLFSLDADLKIENGNLYTLDSEKFSKEMLNQKNLNGSSATFLGGGGCAGGGCGGGGGGGSGCGGGGGGGDGGG